MTHILQQLFIFIFHDKHILFDSHFKEIYYPNDYTLTMVHIRVWNRTYKTLLYPNQWCHGSYIDAHYVSSRLNELRVKFWDIFPLKALQHDRCYLATKDMGSITGSPHSNENVILMRLSSLPAKWKQLHWNYISVSVYEQLGTSTKNVNTKQNKSNTFSRQWDFPASLDMNVVVTPYIMLMIMFQECYKL